MSTDTTPKVNSYEYATEDIRSYRSSITNAFGLGYAWYEWTFSVDLAQEEIQYMYYTMTRYGDTSGLVPGYEPYYILYVNGVKHIKVSNIDQGNAVDYFINLLNQVRVLTGCNITISFFMYMRASPGAGGLTIDFTIKTVK